MRTSLLVGFITLLLVSHAPAANAETIRVAIGTQDTTINCAAGGLIIRERKLLEKYLPHDGRYKDVTYDIVWHNFTSGAPLTNEMVAGKLDFGAMADFPASMNAVAFQKAGRRSVFLSVLSGSVKGSGNGIVVPVSSDVQSLSDLKGKTISVPFASTAHGMLLRAIQAQGWDPTQDVHIITQAPEIAGSALQSGRIEAHADFVPFADLFPWRGFARKIFDGSQTNAPTFHGTLVDADYAAKYPEIVVAYLKAALDASDYIAREPEEASELIAKVTGVEAEVDYLYHGPLGLQTRDFTWKPEYRQAVTTAFQTLQTLKKIEKPIEANSFINDSYIREAYKESGRDYDAASRDYAQSPLQANDALTGESIVDAHHVGQIWVKGEAKVRAYATLAHLFQALGDLERHGAALRVTYAQDRVRGIKLFAAQAWYVKEPGGVLDAFLLKEEAQTYASSHAGQVITFSEAREAATASAQQTAR